MASIDMIQTSLFEAPRYSITRPIRLIELFAGIGAQAKSLERLQEQGLCTFEHHRVIEFDKYASNAYNAIHGTSFEPMDITRVKGSDLGIADTDKYCYVLTYSFPCQALSLAGKQGGMAEGSGTTSSLLWEVKRILEELKKDDTMPEVLLMENVPQVHGKKNIEHFRKFISFLNSLGYSSFYQDMNAKDYGIPQNRNRCFMVSIYGDWDYRFPQPIPLEIRLKDMLEDEVDEKYYLSNEHIERIQGWKAQQKPLERINGKNSVSPTLTARGAGEEHSGMVLYSDKFEKTGSLGERKNQDNG